VLAIGLALAAISFYPLVAGSDGGDGGPIRFSSDGAVLFGGNGGVLVLDKNPSAWTAARLAGEIRRTGIRGIELMVILDPRESYDEGTAFLADDLGAGKVLVSPWRKGAWPGPGVCTAVWTDTLLTTGKTSLVVNPPAITPAQGSAASRDEASLRISPLD
jgi:hypothetical protein